MDLYVLDKNLDTVAIIDVYSSLIWTDRYQEYGDFELYAAVTPELLSAIKTDYYIWRRDSEHVMIIDDILINTNAESGRMMTVTGKSLESILNRRVVWGLKTFDGNLQEAIETLLDESFINPTKPERKVSNFIFEESDDPVITEMELQVQYTGDNIYDIIHDICVERGLGFKITLNNSKQFVFKLYSGVDRSYGQTTNSYVVFSPKFDNFIDGDYHESRSEWKNVTLVGGEGEGSKRRYTAVGNTSGLDRRETFTDARDISSDIDEDITETADFTEYPSQVFKLSTKTFVTDTLFNSCMIDVSAYIGRVISITIPQFTNASGAASGYATVLVNASKAYVSTLQEWEIYNETESQGTLKTYEFEVPEGAQYIYTSMYSQSAIDSDIYYGETTDFVCKTVKLSSSEYITQLRQRGSETLAENVEEISFEGEAETTIMYRYGEHFFNGDIVQISDEYGHEIKARVLEIITSENEEGYTVYPTFSTLTEIDTEEGA